MQTYFEQTIVYMSILEQCYQVNKTAKKTERKNESEHFHISEPRCDQGQTRRGNDSGCKNRQKNLCRSEAIHLPFCYILTPSPLSLIYTHTHTLSLSFSHSPTSLSPPAPMPSHTHLRSLSLPLPLCIQFVPTVTIPVRGWRPSHSLPDHANSWPSLWPCLSQAGLWCPFEGREAYQAWHIMCLSTHVVVRVWSSLLCEYGQSC